MGYINKRIRAFAVCLLALITYQSCINNYKILEMKNTEGNKEFVVKVKVANQEKHLLLVEAGAPTFRRYLLEELSEQGYMITLFTHVPAQIGQQSM